MKNYRHIFYLNGNFDNKGCEAIVRGATEILKSKQKIFLHVLQIFLLIKMLLKN